MEESPPTDRAAAALLTDLDRRGLLDETLVVIGLGRQWPKSVDSIERTGRWWDSWCATDDLPQNIVHVGPPRCCIF